MKDVLQSLRQRALLALSAAQDEPQLLSAKAQFLGKKGELTALLKELATLAPDERRDVGRLLNEAKQEIEEAQESHRLRIQAAGIVRLEHARTDISLPGRAPAQGNFHPVYQVLYEVQDIFFGMGFDLEEGPDIEDDFHNFEALNLPKGHPARDMQDTFYVDGGFVLRTHTSPVQVHTMQRRAPPIRMIAPGTAYRADMDMTHSPMFHQVEGLMVDHHVCLSDLKGVLLEFVRRLFGPQCDIKFRASFFPFTEPSAEVDVLCFLCSGSGCRTCKHTGWLEIGGCGMVNRAVFAKIARPEYQDPDLRGFAFGMGIERIAMLKFGIPDVRLLFENDLRMLHQFTASNRGLS